MKTNKYFTPKVLIIASVLLISITAIFIWLQPTDRRSINNFYDCQKAGGGIGESYPEQCFIDGK